MLQASWNAGCCCFLRPCCGCGMRPCLFTTSRCVHKPHGCLRWKRDDFVSSWPCLPLQKPDTLQFLWSNATIQASRPSLLNKRRSCQPCVASRGRPTKLSAWFAHNQQARSRVPVYALGGGTTAVATELLEDNGGPSITNAAEWLWAG